MKPYFQRFQSIWHHPGNREAPLAATTRIVRGCLSRIHGRPLIMPLRNSVRIKLYPRTDYWRNLTYYGPWAEFELAHLLIAALRPGDRYVDIGANIGYTALLAYSCVGPTGSALLAEPIPINGDRLLENLALNGITNFAVTQVAVGATEGTVEFTIEDTVSHRSLGNGKPSIEVQMVTLDTLIDRPVAVCKVDVEGLESEVFSGAVAAMERGDLPVILFEHNGGSRRYGVGDNEVLDSLLKRGYRLGQFDPSATMIVWDGPVWNDVVAATPAGQMFLETRLAEWRSAGQRT